MDDATAGSVVQILVGACMIYAFAKAGALLICGILNCEKRMKK
jgi:hypothetical protein